MSENRLARILNTQISRRTAIRAAVVVPTVIALENQFRGLASAEQVRLPDVTPETLGFDWAHGYTPDANKPYGKDFWAWTYEFKKDRSLSQTGLSGIDDSNVMRITGSGKEVGLDVRVNPDYIHQVLGPDQWRLAINIPDAKPGDQLLAVESNTGRVAGVAHAEEGTYMGMLVPQNRTELQYKLIRADGHSEPSTWYFSAISLADEQKVRQALGQPNSYIADASGEVIPSEGPTNPEQEGLPRYVIQEVQKKQETEGAAHGYFLPITPNGTEWSPYLNLRFPIKSKGIYYWNIEESLGSMLVQARPYSEGSQHHIWFGMKINDVNRRSDYQIDNDSNTNDQNNIPTVWVRGAEPNGRLLLTDGLGNVVKYKDSEGRDQEAGITLEGSGNGGMEIPNASSGQEFGLMLTGLNADRDIRMSFGPKTGRENIELPWLKSSDFIR